MPDPKKKKYPKSDKIRSIGDKPAVKRKPNSTDSLATWMYKDDKRTVWADIAKAAEKKHGKIDVSKFNIRKDRNTSSDAARREYKLGIYAEKDAPFKMAYQDKGGAPALMKALVGDQHKLPDHLKKAIKAAPEDSPAKSYGSKKNSPINKKKNPNRSDAKNVKEGIDVNNPKVRKMYDKYKESGGKLSINQAARIGFASPSESKRRLKQANYEGSQGRDGLKDL